MYKGKGEECEIVCVKKFEHIERDEVEETKGRRRNVA